MKHPIARFYHPKGPDRVAVASVQPSVGLEGAFVIRLARGTGPGPLKKGTVYGPFPQEELDSRFAEIVANLKAEGFLPTGVADLLLLLESPDAAKRARAALGLGWRQAMEAVEPILAAVPKAVDEICSYLDALGAIGDPRALPVLREQAARKLLSRRRSAAEALRNLNDEPGLAAVRQQALERLPATLRQALEAQDPHDPTADAVTTVSQAALALPEAQLGLALDTLYELATPLTVAATRKALKKILFDRPNLWRYVKSIHKRALLRHDHVTFGRLSHRIERQGRVSSGTHATVKSGYDGVQRKVHIFGCKTQQFMRRLSWRYLRQLAIHRPELYAHAAADALVPYSPDDGEKPRGMYGQYASCYLLNRILWGRSSRLVMSQRSLRFAFRGSDDVEPPPHAREEPYPHLWDEQPRAYLRLLTAARLEEVHAFAVSAVEKRHPHLLQQATAAEVLALLQAPHPPTVKLGLKELERRFDPKNPDWTLLEQLLRDERTTARELGERWLRLTAPAWTGDVGRIAAWLSLPQPASRALAAELSIAALAGNPGLRTGLARHIWELLRTYQLKEEVADGFVKVAREVLLDDLQALVSVSDLLDWIGRGPVATLLLAGELLGRQTEQVAALGVERLAQLAQHDIAAVRAGAQRLLRAAAASFQHDPSVLLVLVESPWEDTRRVAVKLLRDVLRTKTLGLDALLGLLDSNEIEVQNLGQELAALHLASLPVAELVYRLTQHPHPNMRRFALDLVVQHLPEGAEPLQRLEQFFRTVLFDVTPARALKLRVLDFLKERGLRDEASAAMVAPILADVVRVEGRGDFERALEALVRLKLAYPHIAAPVKIRMEGVA